MNGPILSAVQGLILTQLGPSSVECLSHGSYLRIASLHGIPRDDSGRFVCREHDRLSRDHCRLVAKSVAIIPYEGIDNSFRIDSTALLNLINYRAAVNQPAREHGKVSDPFLRLQDGGTDAGEARALKGRRSSVESHQSGVFSWTCLLWLRQP
jgi:hypothetical protein